MRTLLLLLLAAAGAAAAQNTNDGPSGPQNVPRPKSNWELEQEQRNPVESPVALPALPRDADLIEFYVSNMVSFRFFIDAASLSVGPDRVVRYTLVARSPSGIANVSHEGIRCADLSYRIYAYGQDGRWAAARNAEWREIEPKTVQRWHNELRLRFFCIGRAAILSAADGLEALRHGGLPGSATRPGWR